MSREEILDYFKDINHAYNDCTKHDTLESTLNEMLNQIKLELHATAEMHQDGGYYLRDEWVDEIINKY